MPREPPEDSPVDKLVNMLLIDMIKKKIPLVRVRADGPVEEWTGSAWKATTMTTPPAKVRPAMIDRLKEMADIPDDAPLRFESIIRLMTAPASKYNVDVVYSRSEGGGVVVLAMHELVPDMPKSDEDVMQKASILLSHASDAPTRDDVRSRVREALHRVKDQPARAWLLRRAASTCLDAGIYDDALEYLALARELHADLKVILVDIDAQMGVAFVETNRLKEAEAVYRRALDVAESLPRPSFYEIYIRLRLAQLALEKNELDAAEAELARLDGAIELLLGPKSLARILPRAAQVRLMRERGDAAAAETLAIASMREAEDGGLVGEADDLRVELAEIALGRGDANSAIDHLREVLQLPSRSPMRARIYTTLARAQRAIGRDADATSSLRAAVSLADGALAPDHPLRIEAERELATLTATAPYR
jgi:tetratricopeptide (TPR) repeat protein